MITESFFSQQLHRLTQSFGDRAFTPERIRRIRKITEDMSEHGLSEIIEGFVDNARHAPVPNDFLAAKIAWNRANRTYQDVVSTFALHCKDCYDTGFIFCRLNESEPNRLVFCHCDAGADSESMDQFRCMPRWEKGVFDLQFGFIKDPFPLEKLKPKEIAFEVNEHKEKEFIYSESESFIFWSGLRKSSDQYWFQKSQEHKP